MADILIRGMEMPKDGVYWCEIGVAGEIATITIHGEERKSFPLVSVPPHGRLIDGDELASGCDEPHWCRWLSEIEDAPTIVPAEGEVESDA